ncbi:mechanosensitive ion channel family protein [Limibaculum sp. FT325]|uniref:mechanosensitive ion channel family protein n=1 Tax=Thermohalobaculum sediminis TaxID=2939436 RepID=UPI0020BF0335|nr:mechanosensitive ion channel family protein [Limibaculum sediminis]MCL5779158.1 mechanosensitive ion channel family protein [Limibaculum sediminis]
MFIKYAAGFLLGLLLVAHPIQKAASQPVDAAPNATVASQSGALPSLLLDPETPSNRLEAFLIPLTEEDLAKLAAHWQGLLKAHMFKMSDQYLKLNSHDEAVRTEARATWNRLADQRQELFLKFDAILVAWNEKGGDPKAIAGYRRYEIASVVEGARDLDAVTASERLWAWMKTPSGGIALAIKIAIFAGSLIGLITVAALARGFAQIRLRRVKRVSQLLKTFVAGAIYWVVTAVGLVIVLGSLGVDVTPLFAIFGGASFILAFAFQDTLGNLASGLMIMVNKPFDEGDFVNIGGSYGTVKSVSIVATRIVTPDNQSILIPNKQVWGSIIVNLNASRTRRVDLVFGVGYGDDIPTVIEILREAVAENPRTLDDPKPVIMVGELADSCINILCQPWVLTPDYMTARSELIANVKKRFDAAGVSIPYPQRDVHLYRSDTSESIKQ